LRRRGVSDYTNRKYDRAGNTCGGEFKPETTPLRLGTRYSSSGGTANVCCTTGRTCTGH